jgi:hypothetical protein
MVGEMVALLLWEISNVTLLNDPLDEAGEKALFGSTLKNSARSGAPKSCCHFAGSMLKPAA